MTVDSSVNSTAAVKVGVVRCSCSRLLHWYTHKSVPASQLSIHVVHVHITKRCLDQHRAYNRVRDYLRCHI